MAGVKHKENWYAKRTHVGFDYAIELVIVFFFVLFFFVFAFLF